MGVAQRNQRSAAHAQGGGRVPVRVPVRVPSARCALRAALLAGLLACAACASPSSDVHLAPFFSHVSRAGGGREVDALAGAVRLRRPTPAAAIDEWALRPLVSHRSGDVSLTHFLVPLGQHRSTAEDTSSRLIPLYWYQRHTHPGERSRWRFFSLLGFVFGRQVDGSRSIAWFPLGGHIVDYLSWDRIDFVLFPLFVRTQRFGRNTWHFLWPLFNWGDSYAGRTRRFLPFYAESVRDGVFERRSYVWPFLHVADEDLDRPPAERTHRWMLFPLLGRSTRGSFQATTFLWPFFGYSSDSQTGYRAWDGPWPFVRFQSGGANPSAETRQRFWPFWSHFENDRHESTWYLWPLFNVRREEYPDGSRTGSFLVPFWQGWHRTDSQGETQRRWTKLWPLYQDYEEQGARRWAFPALNPFWPTPVIDDHYAWIYELFAVETDGRRRSERSWGGLWRRERDELEERAYLSGLWSRRRYRAGGEAVRETALLFGLVRWRSRPGERFDLMAPAFPGPGWPSRRTEAP